MPVEILMPALSPTMTSGNLAQWLKKEGDKIKPGDVIAEIETDKATMEVESIDEGILAKILVPGSTEGVEVNSVIGILLLEGETQDDLKDFAKSAPEKKSKIISSEPTTQPEISKVTAEKAHNDTTRIFASPLAKRIASDNGIDLKNVSGSGPHGRIIRDDVINISTTSAKPNKVQAVFLGRSDTEFVKIPNSNMRKVIAKRLIESKQNIPHFYLSIECSMDRLLSLREEMNLAAGSENPKFKLSVNDFIIKASALALRDVPEANGSWTDEAVLRYLNVDIAVAVAIEGGLITPIVKNADQKTLSTISNEMKDLAARARLNSLAPHEFQGGGFSISNLGMFGIKKFQAIINPPQSCILACGATTKRPVVNNNEIKISQIADFSLSCDHRVVDGKVGADFLASFKSYIENPVLMFS